MLNMFVIGYALSVNLGKGLRKANPSIGEVSVEPTAVPDADFFKSIPEKERESYRRFCSITCRISIEKDGSTYVYYLFLRSKKKDLGDGKYSLSAPSSYEFGVEKDGGFKSLIKEHFIEIIPELETRDSTVEDEKNIEQRIREMIYVYLGFDLWKGEKDE